ncbi:MogA/MoaB family molybdenum cofactor biosynthesis protein [Aestuariimicrobium sp. T2.26MG-19.2B]|uniref:MogA/MoaB family molybdenum cofactor biosynthesis protein n=1 Tax=Aestuariimicrobium sp. T2.26MG-19.2B TaxID=3040679 RepID=UPI002477B946|nr:MogA/MoaB family molybdenum cofactor biosynthesis protein [Aestuariimicrobium sp. T2.26MG-19.2B]CAI9402358.1 Molybdopterin adenylyltransferase [Aestuariimicrobium sp. T2.26MG-19.2B]
MSRALVITCSDRAHAQLYEDRSGPILRDGLVDLGFEVDAAVIVPDEVEAIRQAIIDGVESGARVVITTGGTGVGPRDVTVRATRDLLDQEIPGISEAIRAAGAHKTPQAWLSSGLAGVARREGRAPALVVNVPGSRGGARDALTVLGPLLGHVVDQLDGGDHPVDPV